MKPQQARVDRVEAGFARLARRRRALQVFAHALAAVGVLSVVLVLLTGGSWSSLTPILYTSTLLVLFAQIVDLQGRVAALERPHEVELAFTLTREPPRPGPWPHEPN